MSTQARTWPAVEVLAYAWDGVLREKGRLTLWEVQREITALLSWDQPIPLEYVRAALHLHRNHLSSSSRAIVVHTADWTYELTEDSELIQSYLKRRIMDGITRHRTELRQAEVAAAATDGRTLEGKIARAFVMHHRHLDEVIESIKDMHESQTMA